MHGMLILGLLWPGGAHGCRSGAAPVVGSTDSPHTAEPSWLLSPPWTPAGAAGRSVTVAMAVVVPPWCEWHQASPSRQGRNPCMQPTPARSLAWLRTTAQGICCPFRAGGGGFNQPRQTFIRKSPSGPGLQHLSSRMPWNCFRSTEEPKLACDNGAAFPQLRGWGGGCGDAICSSLRFHPLLGPGARRRKGQERDGAMGPLNLGVFHGFQSPSSAMGAA